MTAVYLTPPAPERGPQAEKVRASIPTAAALVDAVHSGDPKAVAEALHNAPADCRDALVVVLAAMVDVDRSTEELLGWTRARSGFSAQQQATDICDGLDVAVIRAETDRLTSLGVSPDIARILARPQGKHLHIVLGDIGLTDLIDLAPESPYVRGVLAQFRGKRARVVARGRRRRAAMMAAA